MTSLKIKKLIFSKVAVNFIYRISSNKRPRCLFNFGALKCGAYWSAALKRGSHLFQRKISYSHEISRLCNFLFPNNNK